MKRQDGRGRSLKPSAVGVDELADLIGMRDAVGHDLDAFLSRGRNADGPHAEKPLQEPLIDLDTADIAIRGKGDISANPRENLSLVLRRSKRLTLKTGNEPI